MPTWMRLAWLNRERIVAAARKLKWPLRTWVALLGLALLGAGLYLGFSREYLRLTGPDQWSAAQWLQLTINLIGFTVLYLAQRTWWNRQDEVWEEVDRLRAEVDALRERMPRPTPTPKPVRPSEVTQVIPVVRAAPMEREPATVERDLGTGRTFSFRSQ
jgi:hypothetical protein